MSEAFPLETEVSRGTQARAILENDLFKEAVEKVQQDIFDKFASIDPSDKEGMVIQRLRLNALAEITRNLKDVLDTGILAEKQIEHEQTLAQRMKERVSKGIRSIF